MYYYVYILESISFPDKNYIGYTTDLKNRLSKYNEGGSPYTSKYKPSKIRLAISFSNKEKAFSFEKYLKSHSGKAFISKHF
jgi:putative endonuclease